MNGTIRIIESGGSLTMGRQGFGEGRMASSKRDRPGRDHACDGCGEVNPDVDLWAEDYESGEELWLCVSCGEW